jgi:hypothetical protein
MVPARLLHTSHRAGLADFQSEDPLMERRNFIGGIAGGLPAVPAIAARSRQ